MKNSGRDAVSFKSAKQIIVAAVLYSCGREITNVYSRWVYHLSPPEILVFSHPLWKQ
jgi:hypothetical protein